ncbi:transketolase [Flavisolibacter ginsengisoli]|jgi:transketolase|uniref:Transketolase n=1 Tax=Flavisolibacter ginsengisoli DSM 18119 TaxID=1121884 RepID=A0A1M4ZLS9_9BACT|nr:transketolase [Flavisolibacter ginsengisoli]SHF18971.1 transketolase [Flavisolibacter ginsengisoli DSM 18119]
MFEAKDIREKAKLVRKWCMVSTTEAGSGHPTSCLSAADLTTVLFDRYFTYDLKQPLNIYNDRFVLSKGHAAPLLYTLFGMAGAYPLEDIKSLRKLGSKFEGHPTPRFEYAEAATGSLGQGLSVGAGLALLGKREGLPFKTFVLTGDGELAEGQVWEAANFAAHEKLDNLVAILDINRLAQSQETMFGHHIDEYVNRFRAFDFEVIAIDGHNYEEIDHALQLATSNTNGKPYAIVAKTEKGKGVSFIENKDGWHGKALKKEELDKALAELAPINDNLRFELKKPAKVQLTEKIKGPASVDLSFEKDKEYATREVFGEALVKLAAGNKNIYAIDGDVMNSTFTEDLKKAYPEHFVEGYIAEQNMVSVAAGLSRLGKIPFVATFAAFLTRAADQIRMARVSEANIKFIGSHVGVSIGEDGPSQMGLEDISLFGTVPGTIVLQPCDAISTAALLPKMVEHNGFAYMRTLRSKTPLLYKKEDRFEIGGSSILRQSANDLLTVAATGITVFEALKAADELQKENISIRVVDIYSIHPIDKDTLVKCLQETQQKIIITVEDHFEHGGMGDFALSALASTQGQVVKMAVTKISQSGTKDELLNDAGINASHIVKRVKELMQNKNKKM